MTIAHTTTFDYGVINIANRAQSGAFYATVIADDLLMRRPDFRFFNERQNAQGADLVSEPRILARNPNPPGGGGISGRRWWRRYQTTASFMKFVGMAAAATILATMLGTPAWARDKKAESAILAIEHAIVDARSADSVAQYFDPQVVMYDFTPPTVRGLSAFIGHVNEVFAGMPNFDVQILEMHITADRELGFANSVQRVIVKDAKGSITLDGVFRNTNCYRKVHGHWLIQYEHISFPVDLASGKVVLQLNQP
jgi:ketosteroid isomerase-like protein